METGWNRQAHQALVESDRIQQTADVLLKARGAKPIADLDAALQPATLNEAYAVQDAMAHSLGTVGGWKVGAPGPDATPMFGPMPLRFGFVRSGEQVDNPTSRMRGVEAELGFLLRKDLPIREGRYTREELLGAIGDARPVIEVLESAFVDPGEVPHLAMVADLQMNGGFVHGSDIEKWHELDLSAQPLEITIDGVIRWDGMGRNANGPDLLRLVEFLANEGQYRTGGLEAGQWITTGSWMGRLSAHGRSSVEARFANLGLVAFSFAG